MTFVNLSGLVTWENLSKPHTIAMFNLDSQAHLSWDICLACHVIHGLSAHKTHNHSHSVQTFSDKDGQVARNFEMQSSSGYLSLLLKGGGGRSEKVQSPWR